ncbi:hypothetical protein B0T21DRAFT_388429 [Apiosordaria backusii]|uniref:Uncharacterized protein n=1 Tax=Apiosordaria backusii TaxID=314023 RepID=A0AA40EXG2_9PEZI|nr:hypothetical protein B0T21DRAFT_388429 [Apiosordaria backusii]
MPFKMSCAHNSRLAGESRFSSSLVGEGTSQECKTERRKIADMRLVSFYLWVGFCCSDVIGEFAATDNSTRTSFPSNCISTSRITTKVAGRALPGTVTTTKSYNATTSPKNATLATDNRYEKLWRGKYTKDGSLSNLTSSAAPTVLCSSIADFSSSCSCVSITRATTTSTIRSSTTTLTVTRTTASPELSTSSRSNRSTSRASETPKSSLITASQSRGTAQAQNRLTGTSPNTNGISPTGRFLNTTVSSTNPGKSPVVYVMNTTTLITVTTAPKNSVSAGFSLPYNTTTGRYLNTTATSKPSQGFRLPFWRLNITAPSFFSRTNTSLQAHKVALITGTATGTGLSQPSNITSSRPLWLNTTRAATTTAASTTGPRLFTANTTFNFANTTVRWVNTTTTSSLPTPTPTFPTSCGESSAPFSLQISSPSTPFDNWFVHLSARALLFSSLPSQASRFSVEAGGYLCIPGLVDETEEQRPYVAAVGVKEGQRGEVWMVSKEMMDVWGDDYVALGCTKDGGLSCGGMENGRDVGEVRGWVGCGMQLALGGGNGTVDECGSVGVRVVKGGGGDGEGNEDYEIGEMRFERRGVNPWAFTGMS